jgi:hypothetical protein
MTNEKTKQVTEYELSHKEQQIVAMFQADLLRIQQTIGQQLEGAVKAIIISNGLAFPADWKLEGNKLVLQGAQK